MHARSIQIPVFHCELNLSPQIVYHGVFALCIAETDVIMNSEDRNPAAACTYVNSIRCTTTRSVGHMLSDGRRGVVLAEAAAALGGASRTHGAPCGCGVAWLCART